MTYKLNSRNISENINNSIQILSKSIYITIFQGRGHALVQLVEALRYKPRGCRCESQWRHWIFHRHNPSGRTMDLGLTQPLTEISTRNISWDKGGRCVRLTTLLLYVPIVLKSGNLTLLERSGPVQACNGIALHFYIWRQAAWQYNRCFCFLNLLAPEFYI
jgi:hypothetical protein